MCGDPLARPQAVVEAASDIDGHPVRADLIFSLGTPFMRMAIPDYAEHSARVAFVDEPPALSPRVARIGEVEGDWYVAHTKSRQEKAFAADLLRRGIDYF